MTGAFGLHHPAQDLIGVVLNEVQKAPSLRWLRRRGDDWRSRADPDETPPWLSLSALPVLVVSGARIPR